MSSQGTVGVPGVQPWLWVLAIVLASMSMMLTVIGIMPSNQALDPPPWLLAYPVMAGSVAALFAAGAFTYAVAGAARYGLRRLDPTTLSAIVVVSVFVGVACALSYVSVDAMTFE